MLFNGTMTSFYEIYYISAYPSDGSCVGRYIFELSDSQKWTLLYLMQVQLMVQTDVIFYPTYPCTILLRI